MSLQVVITKGFYRGQPVEGTFPLVKPYNSSGGFITVKNSTPKSGHPPVQRIQVEVGSFSVIDSDGNELEDHQVVGGGAKGEEIIISTDYESAFISGETDEEAMDRIEATFLMLDKITDGCTKPSGIRGLVVTGPPGIGKSFGVEKQLEAANMFRTMAGKDPKYEIVSGGVSSVGLYQKLYYNRGPENVIVFDDCDGVLFDDECLNLLKAALNSGDRRRICWNKESRVLAVEDIPESFDFEGSVIFLSNIDFERTIQKGSKIAKHLEAIMSRCHYLDLEIGSMRDRLLRIKQVMRDGMLSSYNFTASQEDDIWQFVNTNNEYLREVSLRMVKKIADFVKTDPTEWKEMAESTCLHREAKFKRLLLKRQEEATRRGVELA